MDKEDIKEQAKRIIDNFAKALESVKAEEENVERDEDRREEKETSKPNAEFRKIILENAPDTKEGCIVAEKGKWAK
jgi:predicted Asp-tRNA(Asn)/Glu-tRNA(Gln) amidotransferase subunit C